MLEWQANYGLTVVQRQDLHQALIWSKDFFNSIPAGAHIGGHGFDKTMRQAGMAAVIAQGEDYPVFLPVLTAMAMDVGRATLDPRSRTYQHGEVSRELIEAHLFDRLFSLSAEDRKMVAEAVEDHPKLNKYVRGSYVVKVAMDADRLDCLGTFGPLRAASWRPNIPLILPEELDTRSGDTDMQSMFQDMNNRQLGWFEMLWTETAREIALPRVLQYKVYLERFQEEAKFSYQAYERLGIN